MKVNPQLVFYTVIAIAGAYVINRVFGAGESVAEGVKNFSEGVRLYLGDRSILGTPIQLSAGAALSQEEHIKAGHLELLPGGRTRLTAAGRLYVEQQQREAALNP